MIHKDQDYVLAYSYTHPRYILTYPMHKGTMVTKYMPTEVLFESGCYSPETHGVIKLLVPKASVEALKSGNEMLKPDDTIRMLQNGSYTHLLTHSLTHLLTHSLTHSLTHVILTLVLTRQHTHLSR